MTILKKIRKAKMIIRLLIKAQNLKKGVMILKLTKKKLKIINLYIINIYKNILNKYILY